MKPSKGHSEIAPYDLADPSLAGLALEQIAAAVAIGADVTLLVAADGTVKQVFANKPSVSPYELHRATGKKLRDCVTIESIEKIDEMLDRGHHDKDRAYQVNHAKEGLRDLPVSYRVHHSDRFADILVVGKELSGQSKMQDRLIKAQMELESGYRELQDVEARYRTAFRISAIALVLIDGERKTIIDANPAAVALLGASANRFIGRPVRDYFDREERDRLADAMSEARHSDTAVKVDQIVTGNGDRIAMSIRSYRENRVTNMAATLWQPSALVGEATELAPVSGDEILDIASLPEPAIKTDLKGRVLAVNDLFLDLIHAPSAGQVTGRNISTWFSSSAIDIQVLYSRLQDETAVRGFSSTLHDNLSGDVPVSLAARRSASGDSVQIIANPVAGAAGKAPMQPLGIPESPEGFASLVGKVPMKELIRESLDVIEKLCIEAALEQTNNNRASAAELLGLSRQSLYIKLRRYGLEDFQPGAST